MGLQSVHHTSSLLLLPPHTLPLLQHAPQTGPSRGPTHWLQLSTNCSSMGPFQGVQSFRNKLLQCGSPTGSQAQPANLLQCGLSMGHSLLQASPCSGVGSSPGCRWGSAPPWSSTAAADSLPHHGLLHGCTAKSLLHCLEHLLPSSCTDCGLCRAVSLTYSHSSIPVKLFFLLLKCVITEVLPPLPMGSALASSRFALELAGTGSIGHRGSF